MSHTDSIRLLDHKLEQILGCPSGWGGVDAIEPLVLTLLMLRASLADPPADERGVLRDYRRFLAERFGGGATDLKSRLGSDASESSMVAVLREYANRQRGKVTDLHGTPPPTPPDPRPIGGDEIVDITRPHNAKRRAS
jgi:hypothetical protein